MHYFPLAWPFFVALVALLGLLLVLLELGVLEYAYGRIGVERKYMLLLLVGSLLGSYVNIPAVVLPAEHVYAQGVVSFYGVQYVVPEILTEPRTLLAVNLGGAVIPTVLSIYLILRHRAFLSSAVVVAVVAAVVHSVATPVPGVGIALPTFLPALVTAAVVLLISRRYAAPLAYIGGSLGTLIGADLMNLGRIRGLGAPVASIGGAGTFDGIFLTGILSVLLASWLSGGMPVAEAPHQSQNTPTGAPINGGPAKASSPRSASAISGDAACS